MVLSYSPRIPLPPIIAPRELPSSSHRPEYPSDEIICFSFPGIFRQRPISNDGEDCQGCTDTAARLIITGLRTLGRGKRTACNTQPGRFSWLPKRLQLHESSLDRYPVTSPLTSSKLSDV